MKFIDTTEIHIKSGDGGSGMSSFRTARNRPKLGADGGNGGTGGDVILVGSQGINTLNTLRYKQRFKAENGEKGGTNNRTGRCGDPCLIHVPLGTCVINADSNEIIGEVLEDGEKLVVATGGKRGYGNHHFLSATHQSPRDFSPGEDGTELALRLELKVLADVGLAGFPNAGKSTLLSRMSAARPKIADYPFTTLTPNLGVVDTGALGRGTDSFVIADIPGLIEGASEGKGLGHAFLKHLERTRIILYIVDGFSDEDLEVEDSVAKLRKELLSYNPEFAHRESMVLVNKIDLAPEGFDSKAEAKRLSEKLEAPTLFISGVSGNGLETVKSEIIGILERIDAEKNHVDEDQFIADWASDRDQ